MPYSTIPGPRILLLIMLVLMMLNPAYAGTGDELKVTGSIVNLRAEPTLDSRVLMRVAEGRTLIEISRYQDWVEVATRRADIDTGWIHSSLLSAVGKAGSSEPDPTYLMFVGEFNRVNDSLTANTGEKPFLNIEQITQGELRIIAAAPWFALVQSEREAVLSGLFSFWQQQNGVASVVSLEVVDQNGQAHMMMFQ